MAYGRREAAEIRSPRLPWEVRSANRTYMVGRAAVMAARRARQSKDAADRQREALERARRALEQAQSYQAQVRGLLKRYDAATNEEQRQALHEYMVDRMADAGFTWAEASFPGMNLVRSFAEMDMTDPKRGLARRDGVIGTKGSAIRATDNLLNAVNRVGTYDREVARLRPVLDPRGMVQDAELATTLAERFGIRGQGGSAWNGDLADLSENQKLVLMGVQAGAYNPTGQDPVDADLLKEKIEDPLLRAQIEAAMRAEVDTNFDESIREGESTLGGQSQNVVRLRTNQPLAVAEEVFRGEVDQFGTYGATRLNEMASLAQVLIDPNINVDAFAEAIGTAGVWRDENGSTINPDTGEPYTIDEAADPTRSLTLDLDSVGYLVREETATQTSWHQPTPKTATYIRPVRMTRWEFMKEVAKWDPATLAAFQTKLDNAGFMISAEGITRDFETIYTPGVLDPTTRSALDNFLSYAMAEGPKRGATFDELLDELSGTKAKAISTLDIGGGGGRSISLSDPAYVRQLGDQVGQALLGRNLTEAERTAIVQQVGSAERGAGDVNIHPESRIIEEIRRRAPVESGAHDIAGVFSMFADIIGAGLGLGQGQGMSPTEAGPGGGRGVQFGGE